MDDGTRRHDETRRNVDHELPVSSGKRGRSASLPPSPRQRFQSIQKDDAPRFEKRARHKTREDRYEPRNDPPDQPSGRTVERKGQHRRRTEEPVRKRLASARDVIDNFASDSILNNRLTLQPATTPGLFQNGHASAHKQPTDLAFNSMNFLARPRERKQTKQPKDTGKKEREVQEMSAFFRGDHEPARRRRSGGSPGPQRRKSTPAQVEHGRTETPARSPVTTYLTWSPSVARDGQTESRHSRRLKQTAENTVQHTTQTHKQRPRRETSSPPPPRRIVRYKDKGVMTLETRMGIDSGSVNTRDGLGLEDTQEKTKIPADQPCQIDIAKTSVAKEPAVDRSEENIPGPADLEITDTGRLLEPNPKNTAKDNEKLPPTRSSSPEYLASLEKVVSGWTTIQDPTHPVSKVVPPGKPSQQQALVAAPNSDRQTALPEPQEKSSRSEAWIADDRAINAPQAGVVHGYEGVGPCDHHQHLSYPTNPNLRHEYQNNRLDNLISRVDRELAKDAALSQLSHQLYREEADYQCYAAPVLEEDNWMDEPYMHEGEDAMVLPVHEQYQWTDGYTGQQETGNMSQFWRPNMFM
ncbi:hypothetical protein F5X68DRAFT_233985 [Plectosphaerella plurivora]|uniref:Uncharacterized protein n=1 Tax=Plectosphaerella plurivora TaxID=936078 RepID=A0A9P8V7H2_9PEZI|nr:hypothetical protein F5X68DRAFT_233985 [Plectosphaerella plurivora]